MNNLVGIQNGFVTQADALDSNFISSQELNNEGYQATHGVVSHGLAQPDGASSFGLVQPAKYTSGSLILDDYRLPTQEEAAKRGHVLSNGFSGVPSISSSGKYDNSGQYVHDPSGDYADPYKHIDSPAVPYVHDDSKYKQAAEFYDYGRYSASQSGNKYENNGGQYVDDNSGAYVDNGSSSYFGASGYSGSTSSSGSAGYSGSSDNIGSSGYSDSTAYSGYSGFTPDYSGSYKHENSGQYIAGIYRHEDNNENFRNIGKALNIETYNGGYSNGNAGQYLSDSKAYTGASHTLTAGAVNVGLVGKTTLVDAGYINQFNYGANKGSQHSYSHQTLNNAHLPIISQPAVSINHVGTDQNNLDGYSFVTTPTTSGIPTTETPFSVTTAIPTTTYKTTFVTEPPKTSIKEIFGYSQPDVTYVQPTVTAVNVAPKIQVTDYNQGVNVNIKSESSGYENSKSSSGYNYPKPNIKFEEGISYTTSAPKILVSTFKPQGFSHNQQTVHNVQTSNAYIPPAIESGYYYPNPVPVTEEPFKKLVAYTTGIPQTYVQPTPQSFSQQTIHKVETGHAYLPPAENTYNYKHEVTYEQPKIIVEHTTAQPVTIQPVVSYQPQVISHNTLHKVDGSKVNTYSGVDFGYKYKKPSSGYDYPKPDVKFEEVQNTVIQTSAPTISTYKPQSYSQQTFHKYENPTIVSTTPAPQVELTYHQPTVTVYENPILKYKEPPVSPAVYVQPTAQSYSQQTIHKVEHNIKANNDYLPPVHGYENKPTVIYEQPKTVVEFTTAQPVVSTYQPQVYSHQTLHKVESAKVDTSNAYLPPANSYEYKSEIAFEQPKTVVEYTTAQPAVVSTYQPQVYSHQTLHKVEANKVDTYKISGDLGYSYAKPASGYEYHKPTVQFEETPKIIQYTTPAPTPSTYKPHSYSSQTIHKIETPKVVSTVAPKIYQPDVTVYENPILKYVENVTPSTSYTQTYKPVVQQHEVNHFVSQPVQYDFSQQNLQFNKEGYSYSQPEIQREADLNVAKAYSDASLVSHQTYHLYNDKRQQNSGKDVVFVSTTPSTLIYEDHYAEYESPKKVQAYKAPEYIPPKVQYEQTYTVSSTAAPVNQQSSVLHQTQDQYDYNPNEYSQHYDTASVQQVAFSTSHIEQPKKIESIQFSSFPDTKYNHAPQVAYDSPEIQVEYKAEEYLPPVISNSPPVVTTTYKPRTYAYATSKEYLPPIQTPPATIDYLPPQPGYNAPEYLPPKVDYTYLPPSTTARPIVKSTTQIPSTTFKAREYLPPQEPSVISYESFKISDETSKPLYNTYQDYTVSTTSAPIARKQNIVVDIAKSNLLGFGTVGPDAGLVSPVSYTTAAPVISSTYEPYSYEITRTPLPARKNRLRYKPTTQVPVEYTTAYKAPEYLPPVGENAKFESFGLKTIKNNVQQEEYLESTTASQRKQNIVVETVKSQLLGFGTVGPDAGLISDVTYTTAAPTISSTEAYSATPKIVTSTYAPVKQQLIEVSSIPVRRTKPKVAVVTKINDFNPLLVRKLGAVCSCQSPIVVLRGRRPNVEVQQDFDEYGSNDYSDADGRGDINNNEWAQKSVRLQTVNAVTVPTVTKTTFNPIIVPDDSFYQDYQENVDITPKTKELYSDNYVSSTPVVVTERVVKIRPRVSAVTVAPTYKTVLLNQEVAPVVKATAPRRDDLQGIKCERAGLFRHPKQCNKFYACRWDCNKQKFTLHTFNCPVQLSFDSSIGACNWPSQGPACQGDTLLTNTL